ncbi:hypothetical protein Bca52824_025323 [Brassica carinata]|uniref:Uncharacterized protein n=1 Tax=Brassica carinata TaxID=52824 RepID=A0A8X7VM25_BRACI|nr:hypothetical protein Bca52824_025322 [Brassica carinata]KAG2313766.1 hypothetical protein Bca52824_025323 [Brassica carinata]
MRVENDQGQLLDAMDEHTIFLKRLNSRLDSISSWFGNDMRVDPEGDGFIWCTDRSSKHSRPIFAPTPRLSNG